MASQIILLALVKKCKFSDFYCISITAVTNISYMLFNNLNIVGLYHFIFNRMYFIEFQGFRQKYKLLFGSFSTNFSKSTRKRLPLFNKTQHTLNSLYHGLIVRKYFRDIKIKSQTNQRKNLLRFRFYKKSEGEVNKVQS